jgi:hypothetical protein
MRDQDISQLIADHLTKQKKVSMGGFGCAYRGEGGASCAVGCLIKDEYYSKSLETQNAASPEVFNAIMLSIGPSASETPDLLNMLLEWQGYHDGADYACWCKDFENELIRSPQDFHNKLFPPST